jgi:hypothetical protein
MTQALYAHMNNKTIKKITLPGWPSLAKRLASNAHPKS